MIYWELQQEENACAAYLANAALSDAVHKYGIHPLAIRATLLEAEITELALGLLGPDGSTVLDSVPLRMPDFLSCSWIPVFSARARAFCMRHGSENGDFWPCRFSPQSDIYYLHLPLHAEEVVDLERSTFLMTIPAEPPLPFHIEDLVLRRPPLAEIFRAAIPAHEQLFAELLVNDGFKRDWKERGLRGAAFRPLNKSPAARRAQQARR